MKQALVGLLLISVLTLLMVACESGETLSTISYRTRTSPALQADTIHMNESQFLRTSISIKKGAYLTLIDDVAVVHVVANGMWQSNGTSIYRVEAGAPNIDVEFQGNDRHRVGPFNTAGIFHLYCTVHEGMNLTVLVQS